jgi:hypothetical protein
MAELHGLTIEEARDGLRKKQFSSRELTIACLERIEKADELIHSFLSVRKDNALREADAADSKINAGGMLPNLLGIPLAVKDNMLIHGERVSAASKILEPYVGSYDGTAITKLKAENAVLLRWDHPQKTPPSVQHGTHMMRSESPEGHPAGLPRQLLRMNVLQAWDQTPEGLSGSPLLFAE